MGVLKKEIYEQLEEKIAEFRPNHVIVRVLDKLHHDETLLSYLSLEDKGITIYEGNTNEESIDICKRGLVVCDIERGVSRDLKPDEISHYAVFLAQRGYTPQKIISTIEQRLLKKLDQS